MRTGAGGATQSGVDHGNRRMRQSRHYRRALAALRKNPVATDTAVAALLFVSSLVSFYATLELLRQDPSLAEPAKLPVFGALLAVIAPLALRRRFPLTAAGAVVVAFVTGRILLAPEIPGLNAWESLFTVWACWLALYSAVVHARPGRPAFAGIAALTAVLVAEILREVLFYQGGLYRGLPLNQIFQLAYNAAFLALPLLLGAAVRSTRARQQQLSAQTQELRREREQNARRAVLDERVRIARELHDVVAHHVSVMGVQAGAARRVMARQPEQAQQALSSIEASSRQAVAELQHLLGFLRADQADPLTPQPNLSGLADLIAQAGNGPLTVDLQLEGDHRQLPDVIELSAYRLIQEALTNAVKHSGGTAAHVRVAYGEHALDIVVCDNGTGSIDPSASQYRAGGGHGLIGMRERVRLHGGHLQTGPLSDGGFVVRAHLPLDRNPS
jgi:signal transduction histidine kinase